MRHGMTNEKSETSEEKEKKDSAPPTEGKTSDSKGTPPPAEPSESPPADRANGQSEAEGRDIDGSAGAFPQETREKASVKDELAFLKKALEAKERENKELSNRLLRALADYDNVKKRSAKEVLNAMQSGSEDLVKKLLPVVDSFESALRHFADADIDKKVLDGFEMLFLQFSDILEKDGLKPIKALGSKFDPNLHEAIAKASQPDKADEIILREFEKGYSFKDKVIRSAKVEINQK